MLCLFTVCSSRLIWGRGGAQEMIKCSDFQALVLTFTCNLFLFVAHGTAGLPFIKPHHC